jgi:hypothetical protein
MHFDTETQTKPQKNSDTMGLENVGPLLVPFLRTSDTIGTVHCTLNHD